LKCLERPRFFAGQLLTEADFNTEQDYILAKNRLHNRYLHGPGVVCGLQVVCSDCDGWVTVQPGYAIDPCGNDIIVCEPAALNVIEAINECCGIRRRRPSDCDPYRPPQDDLCKQSVQTWCITIEYQERESRGTMPLRNPAACGCACGGSGKCGCGCGGKKHANGNGNGKSKSACACTPPKNKPTPPSQCEPTRILETFKLCVAEPCPDPADVKEETLLGNLARCARIIADLLAGLPPGPRSIIQTIATGGVPAASPAEILDACCRLRQALIDLIANNDFLVHCQIMRDVPTCAVEPNVAGGAGSPIAAILTMIKILEQLVLDCFCRAMLPACSGDPCDDRLFLACVTVKDGRVVNICNFSCRTFSGAFPTLFYWLSGFPLANQILARLKQLCCELNLLDRIDPANNFRFAARQAGYAVPQEFAANLDALLNRFSLENIMNLAGAGAISLPALVGQPFRQVADSLQRSKVDFVERQIAAPGDMPPPASVTGNLFASPGQRVVLYRAGETVAGFAPYDTAQELADTRSELAELRQLVESMRG
jgi:hypothetical protein